MSWITISVDSFIIASYHNDKEVEKYLSKGQTYSPEYFKDIKSQINKNNKFYHLCCVLGDLEDDVEVECY